MSKITRYFDVELRATDENDKQQCGGHAVVFNSKTDLGWFTEEIDPHAFDNADMSNVYMLFNHDQNKVLAGTQNNSLRLKIDSRGLFQESDIVDTTEGKDIFKLVKQNLITKMSFGFTIDRDGGEEWISGEDKDHRIIKKVKKLFDVSLVTYPAYESTNAFARSDSDELAQEHKALVERRNAQTKKMEELINGNSK